MISLTNYFNCIQNKFTSCTFKQLVEYIFYGNYFYGICAVAIMFETSIQLNLTFDGPLIYFMAFMATTLFYNYPYARKYSIINGNERTLWYNRKQKFIAVNQIMFTILLSCCLIWLAIAHYQEIKNMYVTRWLLILVFPSIGALYYGINFISHKHNLRNIGWLKPFAIGFVWAGLANVYPILYSDLIHNQQTECNIMHVMLFLKALMFVSILAIMFDIKDYVADSKTELNTLIVKIGLRKTIFFVIIPIIVLGLITFISFALIRQFSLAKMLLIMIPFVLLIAATLSFKKRRTLLYYLIVIDGLLIVKAFFGIIATFV